MITYPPRWEHRLWTRRGEGSLVERGLRAPLTLMAQAYGAAVSARAAAYARGTIAVSRVSARVIVVGNLTVGGTGKTTLAAFLAESLAASGRKVAVISRGYGGRAGAGPLTVSDGRGRPLGPEQAGDEAALLARRLPGVPVLAGADRVRVARAAIEMFGAEIIILDDGYQHLALHRDLNLLVLDGRRDPAQEFLLPRGPLREPLAAAARAQALVFSHADGPPRWPWIERIRPGLPSFTMRYRPAGLRPLAPELDPPPLDAPALAFCGLGEPEQFFAALAAAGVPVQAAVAFPDHHRYTKKLLETLAVQARAAGATRLVTTEKDAVKLRPEWAGGTPVAALGIEPDFAGADDRLLALARG
jgi:tetraacyldisaccharide 4'-kinase